MTVDEKPQKQTSLFRGVGVKFYADEWPVVEALMNKTGRNITDLIKSSIANEARRHGLTFPRYDAPEEAAS